jgi:hypothetical protein
MAIYFKCENCGIIDLDVKWQTFTEKTVCPECGKIDWFETWPSSDVIDLFDHARAYEKDSPYFGLVTSVFVCTALELLLERVLFVMALQENSEEDVDYLIDDLLEAYEGRSRRLQLYNKLGEHTFTVEAKSTGNKHFNKHWEYLADIRNKSVHGDMEKANRITPNDITLIITEALDVFSKLWNKYNIWTFDYQYAASHKSKD